MNQEEKKILNIIDKNPQDIQARFDLVKLYFLNKNFEASLPHSKYLIENCVDKRIDYHTKEARKQRKKLMDWLGPTESMHVNSLYYLGMYEELITALENQIEFGKKVVDYFEGFYCSQEVQIYKLAIYLNKIDKEQEMEKRFKEVYQMSPEKIKEMKEEALIKEFEFPELSSW